LNKYQELNSSLIESRYAEETEAMIEELTKLTFDIPKGDLSKSVLYTPEYGDDLSKM
jgi:hypothetical protein